MIDVLIEVKDALNRVLAIGRHFYNVSPVIDAFGTSVSVRFSASPVVSFQIADHMSRMTILSNPVTERLTDRSKNCGTNMVRHLATCLLTLVCATYPLSAQEISIEADPDRRKILSILKDLEDITPNRYSRLADAFDAAWALSVRSEDPILNLSTDREQSLDPGTSNVDAGARHRLRQIFMKSPQAFQKIYQEQTKSAANAALDQALKSADVNQLEAVVQRFQFTEIANQGLQHLIQLRKSRGEYLQAALQLSRWISLNPEADFKQRILQIQLWYQAGLSQDGLDDLVDLLDRSSGSESKVLQQVAKALEIKADLPVRPVTRESLSQWIDQNNSGSSTSDSSNSGSSNSASNNSASNNSTQHLPHATVDVLQPLGNARRTQTHPTLQAGQLKTAWQHSTFSCLEAVELNPGLERIKQQAVLDALQTNNTIAPIASPLVVGDRLIVRSAMNLQAFHLKTGQPLWESFLLDRHIRSTLEQSNDDRFRTFNTPFRRGLSNRPSLDSYWIQTNTSGQLTTDGRTVFAVEEVTSETLRTNVSRQPEKPTPPSNYLRAYDVETGRLRAQAGGTSGIDGETKAANPLAGMYFLGAPLVLGDRIYVIAEAEPGIYLLQLKAAPLFGSTGEFQFQLVFSQLLSTPRFPLREHPVRNQAGIVPSYGRGLIICSTCDEHIIAISAEDHSIQWIYRYSTTITPAEIGSPRGLISGATGFVDSNRFDLQFRWTDALPRIIDDKIIVTPRDSHQLLCLDLQTGKELWARPRGNDRTVATVDHQRVVVTGHSRVSAFRLSDGEELWSTEIQNGKICGSGSSDGTKLQLPTSEPSILTVRLSDGRQLLNQATDRIVGNLIGTTDSLISQSTTEIQRLVAAKSDQQLLLAARRKLLQGNFTEAIDLLRQSIKESNNDEVRKKSQIQFIDATISASQANQSAAIDLIPEAEAMLIKLHSAKHLLPFLLPQMMRIPPTDLNFLKFQDLEYAREQWNNLQIIKTHNSLQLLSEPTKLVAEEIFQLLQQTWFQRQDSIHRAALVVRKERLTFQQIRTAVELRDQQKQSQIKKRLNELLMQQLNSKMTLPETQWWLNACLMTDNTSAAAEFIVKERPQSNDTKSHLTMNGAFTDLIVRQHAGKSGSDSAAVMLVDHMKQNNQTASLMDLLQTTKQHRAWQDALIDNLSGSSLLTAGQFSTKAVSDATLDSAITEQLKLQPTSHWPGVPEVRESDAQPATRLSTRDQAGLVKEDLPVFDSNNQYRHWNFLIETTKEFGSRRPVMIAYDAQGRRRWTHPLGTKQRQAYRGQKHPTLKQYVVGAGQLVMLQRENEVTMLDCSQANLNQNPQVLWKKNLSEWTTQATPRRAQTSSWERTTVYDRQPSGLAPAGPISPYGLPVILHSELLVVDPISGTEQWRATGITEDSSVTVRGDRLYVISQPSHQVEIRSMIDGSIIAHRSIPDWWRDAEENSTTTPLYFELDRNDSIPFRIQVSDGNCTLYRYGTEKVILESYNLDTSTPNWSREFPGKSAVSNVSGGIVAVLSNGNQLQLVDITSGAITESAQLAKTSNNIQYLYLRRSDEHWLVITDEFDQDHNQNPVNQSVIVNGAIHCLSESSGKLAWSYPIQHEYLRIRHPESGQPAISPVAPFLTLMKRPNVRTNPNPFGLGIGRTPYQAKILDVRTGKVLYSDSDLGYTLSNFHMKLKPEDHQILLNFERRSVTFDYSVNLPTQP